MIVPPLLDAQFSTVVLMLRKRGVPAREAAGALLDQWGAPLAKAEGGDPNEPGEHGIPEIGRQERAFYDALNAGRKQAYDDLQSMVYAMFRRRKPFQAVDVWKADEPIEAWKRRAFQHLIEQPARAFMLGQILATEFLENAKTTRPLMPTDVRAIEYLKGYAFSEVSSKFEQMKGSLRNALIQGVQVGDNPKEVARKLAAELDDYQTDLKLIAITETSRAESQGRLQELKDAGDEFVVGSSAFDNRTCPHCKRLIDGKVRRIRDVIGRSNYGRKAKEYLPVIPLHPRCRCVWLPFIGTAAEAKKAMREQSLATV